MMIRNTMISVATAAVLMTGFTGCSSDTNNASTTGGNSDVINNPKVTVTGTVMDTNGNPLGGVAVFVAGMETTTDAGGIYVFDEVPTVNTANTVGLIANTTANGALQVTIAAPAGYLGATVMVTPESQQISSGDPSVLNGGQTNPNTNFIDGYIASAGTAVLPMLNGTVHGVLENTMNGTRPVGVEVCLDLTQTSFNALHNSTATPMGDVSYATEKYCATTVEGGVFDVMNAPVDASLAYNLADWNLAAQQPATVTVEDTVVTNIGELLVVPIITADTIAPVVASVVEGLSPNNNGTNRMMLVDDARTEFTLNFSEPINVDSDGSGLPDMDMTDSVNVYVGATPGTMSIVNASAVYNGNQLTVTLPAALTDGQLVDVHLIDADFRDMSNNFLTLNGNIGYDLASSNVTTLVQLQAFNDLNLDAEAPTGFAQQERDDNGQDEHPLLTQASNAFNDTFDGTNFRIDQMNSADDDNANGAADVQPRLTALGQAIDATLVSVRADEPRVTFTPSGAAQYIVRLQTPAMVDVPFAVGQVNWLGDPAGNNLANVPGQGVIYTPVNPADVTPIEFMLLTGVNAAPGMIMTITPLDDLGYAGTNSVLTLRDNVNPVTVLQRSYGLGNTVNASNTVVKYGQGGQLAQNTGTITPGLPYLAVTAGLLDNLDANGDAITGVAPMIPNFTLDWELAFYDKAFDHDANPVTPDQTLFDLGNTNVYDSTAYPLMPKNRTAAVSFSEDVSLNGMTPAVSGVSVTLDGWTENNDVTVSEFGNTVNLDLVDFDASDVITLANVDGQSGVAMIDFTGITDNAGNAADADTNAKVVFQDRMPPMVLNAEFDGSHMIINFNEAVDLDVGDTVTTGGKTATFAAGDDWVLTNGGTTLSIAAVHLAGLIPADFALGLYQEDAYGAADYNHGPMTWTVSDVNGNDWATSAAGVTPPQFAAVESIGVFGVLTTTTEFNIGDNALTDRQEIVWEFTHPITHRGSITDPAPVNPAFFDYNNAGVSEAASGRIIATNAAIGAAWNGVGTDTYEDTLAGVAFGPGNFAGAGQDTNIGTTEMTLSTDARTVTFSFHTSIAAVIAAGDFVTFTGTTATATSFESEFTGAEVLTVSGTAQ